MVEPGASDMPASTPSAPAKSFVRSPIPAPPHDGNLDRDAKLAAMQEKLEALESENKRLLGEVKAYR